MDKNKWQPGQLPADDEQLLEQFSADDEQLLEQFFMTARQEEMADDGFSLRVMQRIEAETAKSLVVEKQTSRTVCLSWLWTAFCIVAAVGVFTWIGGWHNVIVAVVHFICTKPTLGQLVQLMAIGVLLTTLTVAEMLRSERITLRSLRV